ncbi:MAG TPA: NAD(P)H-hydrate dehydratase [Acidimicrobiales bacterium]|jgi:NAD(P)H-hydrate epimerase
MVPVVTPEEMAAIDAAAPEPVDVLIGRAGAATARAALDLLGGGYGRRVAVVAGKGNNGNDGREAARRLTSWGVRATVIPAAELDPWEALPPVDLVIDAAYGTGFHGEYEAPEVGRIPVLAVDIPSGVDGLTGQVSGRPLKAQRTVTFAALKPGLLFHPGRTLAGEVIVADIGLDVSGARAGVVEAADVTAWVPPRPAVAHKWQAALVVVAGSPGMTGAAHLCAEAAQRAGAGMVRLISPGVVLDPGLPTETVGIHVEKDSAWDTLVVEQLDRSRALVIGPGLGRSEDTTAAVRRCVAAASERAVLVDGDGLTALGRDAGEALAQRSVPAVLTPHDGEFSRLAGAPPGEDRMASTRDLAHQLGAVVLLKGPTTVVAHPDGRVRLVTTGDQRLATAGTGDVLSGIVGALLARGADPFDAAAAGAWLHGTAALSGPPEGLIARDVVAGIPEALLAIRTLEDGD